MVEEKPRDYIEIFHFINPIGLECYLQEKILIDFLNNRKDNISIRIIPFLDFKTIQTRFYEKNNRKMTLEEHNEFYKDAYKACLALYAASFQGKKIGRSFLFEIQEVVINHKKRLTKQVLSDACKATGLDEEMFFEDLQSDIVKHKFRDDQKLIQEMNVQKTPTAIVFTTGNEKNGYLIENLSSAEELEKLLYPDSSDSEFKDSSDKIIRLNL